jgi:hypothetical protein
MVLTVSVTAVLYIGFIFLFAFLDSFKRGSSNYKGTESFYNWYWNGNLHEVYINWEKNNFYLQHHTKADEKSNHVPRVLKRSTLLDQSKTERVIKKVNTKANDVVELMNKIKGDL